MLLSVSVLLVLLLSLDALEENYGNIFANLPLEA